MSDVAIDAAPGSPKPVEMADASAASHFRALQTLTDERGLHEYVSGSTRSGGRGYCTDDNALLLVVTSREPHDPLARQLSHLALNFVLDALDERGRFRNRMDSNGHWADRPRSHDWWGRGIWGFGTAVSSHHDPSVREMALNGFESAVTQRSPSTRAMSYAALGAVEVLAARPGHEGATSILADALAALPRKRIAAWDWPEPRLTYANAVLTNALIVAGGALDDAESVERGLALLAWLLERQTRNGHLSLVGAAGRGPDDTVPMPQQQPVEAASLADACWSAFAATGDSVWSDAIAACAAWFGGDNDTGIPMFDDEPPVDRPDPTASISWNHGAESVLSFISTMQRSRALSARS